MGTNHKPGPVYMAEAPAGLMLPEYDFGGDRPEDAYEAIVQHLCGAYPREIRAALAQGVTGHTVAEAAGFFYQWGQDMARMALLMPDELPAVARVYVDAMEELAPELGAAWAMQSVHGSDLAPAIARLADDGV